MSSRVPPPERGPTVWLGELFSSDLPKRIDEDILRFEARVGANSNDTVSIAHKAVLEDAKQTLAKFHSLSPSDLASVEFKREGIQILAAIEGTMQPQEIYQATGALTELLTAEKSGVSDRQLGSLLGTLAKEALTVHRTPQIAPLVEGRVDQFDLFVHSIQGLEALATAAAMRNEYVRMDRSIHGHQRKALGLPPETGEIPRGLDAARELIEFSAPVIIDALLTSNEHAVLDIERVERAMKEAQPGLIADTESAKWKKTLAEWKKTIKIGSAELSQSFGVAFQNHELGGIAGSLGRAVKLAVLRFQIEDASSDIPSALRPGLDGFTVAHRFDLLAEECDRAELLSIAVKDARKVFDSGDKKRAKELLSEQRAKFEKISVLHRQAYSELIYRLDKMLELL